MSSLITKSEETLQGEMASQDREQDLKYHQEPSPYQHKSPHPQSLYNIFGVLLEDIWE